MTIFDYITATLLIILGLGITELLNDAVGLFRDRQSYRPEWISLAWAGIIFAFQMQFIWAVYELQALIDTWTAFKFLVALMLALLLFASGALIIPRPTPDGKWEPWQRFLENGRWSLVSLACYAFGAFFSNPMYFDVNLFAPANVNNLILGVVLIGIFFLRDRAMWAWATLAIAVYSIYGIVMMSPSTYN